MNRRFLFCCALLLSLFATLGDSSAALGQEGFPEFQKKFSTPEFMTNMDAQRHESRENGMLRVLVRMPSTTVTTRFHLVDVVAHPFWSLQAQIFSVDRASAGIALQAESGSLWLFYISPAGSAVLSYQENGQMRWEEQVSVQQLSYPLLLTLDRDALGSIFAGINGLQVLSRRVNPLNLQSESALRPLEAQFVTIAPRNVRGSSAVFKELSVRGWGKVAEGKTSSQQSQ